MHRMIDPTALVASSTYDCLGYIFVMHGCVVAPHALVSYRLAITSVVPLLMHRI